MIRYARLNIAVDIVPLQQEIGELIQKKWLPHYNKKDYTGEWEVLALRAPNGNANSPIAELLEGGSFQDTEMMAQCPEVKKTLELLHCEKQAVRLLNLKKGAEIKEHRDAELAFENGEARIHIPIFTNPRVEFFLDKTLLCMNEGECWYINANMPHSLKNLGDSDRVHLVFDCIVNDWLKDVFHDPANKISILSEAELWMRTKDEKMLIIQSLRMQNNETSLRIADEMDAKLRLYMNADH